jgi:hypothetical protein
VTLNVYELDAGAEVVTTVPTPSGDRAATFTTTRVDDVITVRREGPALAWNVQIAGLGDDGLFTLAADQDECRLTLPA